MLKFHPLFEDYAVLQRGQPVPVRGRAAPGSRVIVTLAGRQADAVADAHGQWSAQFPPPPSGTGELELTALSDRGEEICARHLVAGDVWLCSGQSNMQWEVSHSQDAEKALKIANLPMIRLFHVPRLDAETEQADVLASWVLCTPESAAAFSAVAFYFARDIQPRIGVPVGLINASWGGTVAEAWMPHAAFDGDPGMEALRRNLTGEADPVKRAALEVQVQSALKEWQSKACAQDPGNAGEKMGWQEPGYDDSTWRTMPVPGFWEQQLKLDADGALWFRRKFTLPAEWEGCELELRLGAVDDFDHTYVNGTLVGRIGPENPNAYCTPRVYPVPAGICRAGENTLAVRVFDHMGSGGFAGGAPMGVFLKSSPDADPVPLAGAWRYEIECLFPSLALRNAPPWPAWPQGYVGPAQSACRIFNGMIAPLAGFPLTGVLWYQGESNESRPSDYHRVFTALIRAWRARWGRELPFFFVQLANFGVRSSAPSNHPWAQIREAQRLTLAVPATGMASAIDIGEATDIHPKNKQEVGRRLARLARARVYGETIEDSGPLFRSGRADGSSVRLTFDHAGGLRFRGSPEGFSLSDEAGTWRWADVKIENEEIVLSHPQISSPVTARYAWDANPACCLENADGLPASPFEWKK